MQNSKILIDGVSRLRPGKEREYSLRWPFSEHGVCDKAELLFSNVIFRSMMIWDESVRFLELEVWDMSVEREIEIKVNSAHWAEEFWMLVGDFSMGWVPNGQYQVALTRIRGVYHKIFHLSDSFPWQLVKWLLLEFPFWIRDTFIELGSDRSSQSFGSERKLGNNMIVSVWLCWEMWCSRPKRRIDADEYQVRRNLRRIFI
jgi:hypothetical protein